jgi:hypothetical protein
MNIDKKKLAGVGLIATALGLFLWTRKAEAACEEGQTKCEDTDLHACVDGKWQLIEANSPSCGGGPIPECNAGDTKCVGVDLYTCVDGEWQLTEEDSDSCKVTPPGPLPEGFEIDKIAAEPPIVMLGNSVGIKVTWFCPNPELIERTFSLQCMINGKTLQHTWTVRAGNGSIVFEHTPANIGTYTATIPEDGIKFNCPNSVSFEVREEPPTVRAYYCPFGGTTEYETIDALAHHLDSHFHGKRVPGQGKSSDVIDCPYCSSYFTACVRSLGLHCTTAERLGASYKLIDHIQTSHPSHPLTVPRCLIIADNIPDLVGGPYARPDPLLGYAVRIDDKRGWQMVGYTAQYWLGSLPTYEHEETHEFVTNPGQHHIEIRGPVEESFRWRKDPYDTPSIIDVYVDLPNLGDRVVCNVGTGEVSVVSWE